MTEDLADPGRQARRGDRGLRPAYNAFVVPFSGVQDFRFASSHVLAGEQAIYATERFWR
jgi:hypothetical protein